MAEGLNEPQPDPQSPLDPAEEDVWWMVMRDMKERRIQGKLKYSTYLFADNQRDHLIDAYQEALDLVVYLRAEIEKRDRGIPNSR